MNIELWLKIGYAALGFVIAAIPLISSLVAAFKKKIDAKKVLATATDIVTKANADVKVAEATAELKEYANKFIAEVESLYKDVDSELKAKNKSAGSVKKDSVMSKLQMQALALNIAFDFDTWSKYVDDVVAMTKIVNAK